MKFPHPAAPLTNLIVSFLLGFLSIAQAQDIPHPPAENQRPSNWKSPADRGESPPINLKGGEWTQPEILGNDWKSKIEASNKLRELASKEYAGLQKTNSEGKWKPTVESIQTHTAPEWFQDAKFGMFIDWGPWSIAGWAPKLKSGQMIPDWYEMRMYKEKPFIDYHAKNWGSDFQRDDFLPLFTARDYDPARLVRLAEESGMKYVVPFAKHHAGFCLWPSAYTGRDAGDLGPRRDLIAPLAQECRKKGLKLGFYLSVEEWEYPILNENNQVRVRLWDVGRGVSTGGYTPDINHKITGKIPVRDYATEYLVPQAKEFIDQYDPDLIWYDGEWRTPQQELRTLEIAAYLYNRSEGRKEVAVNDRYGKGTRSKLGDFYTSEFGHMGDKSKKDIHPWEECRGISQSYGYNWQDTEDNVISPENFIHMFVDIVSNGGNLLLIVNLDGQGALPKVQENRLKELGQWLKINGEGIYATRPHAPKQPASAASKKIPMTQTKDGNSVFLFVKEWPGTEFKTDMIQPKPGSTITLLGENEPLKWTQQDSVTTIQFPEKWQDAASRPGKHTWVLKVH